MGQDCTQAPGADSREPSEQARLMVRRLLLAHEAWYDVEGACSVAGRAFDGHAAFSSHGEKYVLSRKAKLWEVDTGEHLLFLATPHLTAADVRADVAFMEGPALAELVHPAPNHMSTNLGLVWVCDETDEDALRLARRTRFRKNHRLGLWGWTDLRLAVVSLAALGRGSLVTNGAGKVLRPAIEANLGVASPKTEQEPDDMHGKEG